MGAATLLRPSLRSINEKTCTQSAAAMPALASRLLNDPTRVNNSPLNSPLPLSQFALSTSDALPNLSAFFALRRLGTQASDAPQTSSAHTLDAKIDRENTSQISLMQRRPSHG